MDWPVEVGDPVLLHGNNILAVTRVNKYGWVRDRWSGTLLKLFGRLEVLGVWTYLAGHVVRIDNVLADGVSRWNSREIGGRLSDYTDNLLWRDIELSGTIGNSCVRLFRWRANVMVALKLTCVVANRRTAMVYFEWSSTCARDTQGLKCRS